MSYEVIGKPLVAALAAVALLAPYKIATHFKTVHGCHYSCECGTPRGFGCEQQYHRHLHMLCLPVRCERRTDCERTPPVGGVPSRSSTLEAAAPKDAPATSSAGVAFRAV
jgi:hypothetical protein